MTTSPQPLLPGKGYWLITRDDVTIDVSGTMPNPGQDYVVQLSPGWNLVADPFDFNVDWADCKANGQTIFSGQSYVAVQMWDYNGTGAYDLSAKMASGRAYWVKNLTGGTVPLAIPPIVGSAKPLVTPPSAATRGDRDGILWASSGPPPDPPGGFGTTSGGSSSGGSSSGGPPPPPGGISSSDSGGTGSSLPVSGGEGGGGGGGGCFAARLASAAPAVSALMALAFLAIGLGLWYTMDRSFRGG
ncbi:MAG: hypothetical protein HYY93_06190 [Planctomycetes bacterium]|nr:hypothetical protein [Planctomycetota bacterium]